MTANLRHSTNMSSSNYISPNQLFQIILNSSKDHIPHVRRPWGSTEYYANMLLTVGRSLLSFSSLQKRIAEDTNTSNLPLIPLDCFIPEIKKDVVKSFLAEKSKGYDPEDYALPFGILRHIEMVDGSTILDIFDPYEDPVHTLRDIEAIKYLTESYVNAWVLTVLLRDIIHYTDQLFIQRRGVCTDKKVEWAAYKFENFGNKEVSPWKVMRLAQAYDHYQECLDKYPIVKPKTTLKRSATAGEFSVEQTIESLPKYLGLDAKNIQSTYLRKRRAPPSNKFL